jgi:transcriptional regulator with XRE-family HTH domain
VTDELASWITENLRCRGWSIRHLARQIGVSHSYVTEIANGKSDGSPTVIRKMARIFKVSPEEAFRLAGWLPRIPETEQTWLRRIEAQLLMLDKPSRYALESYLCYLVEVEMEQEEMDDGETDICCVAS